MFWLQWYFCLCCLLGSKYRREWLNSLDRHSILYWNDLNEWMNIGHMIWVPWELLDQPIKMQFRFSWELLGMVSHKSKVWLKVHQRSSIWTNIANFHATVFISERSSFNRKRCYLQILVAFTTKVVQFHPFDSYMTFSLHIQRECLCLSIMACDCC
jgi:hypothetical protein